jgi:hypothetical protein
MKDSCENIKFGELDTGVGGVSLCLAVGQTYRTLAELECCRSHIWVLIIEEVHGAKLTMKYSRKELKSLRAFEAQYGTATKLE